MRTVRLGVIGCGGMGSFHARTLAAMAGVDIVAVADPVGANACAVGDAVGADMSTDPMSIAESTELDGVVIASPDDTHADLALAAIARGTFTLCEKPLATTIDDGRRVMDAEVAAGRRLVQLGFMREYDPAHVQLVDALASVGEVQYLRAVHRNSNDRRRSLEQIIGQSLVHDVHSARFLSNCEIVEVSAFGSGPADGSFRHVAVVCTLSSGAHVLLEFDDGGYAYEVTLEILGADGDLVMGGPPRVTRRAGGRLDIEIGTDWFGWFAEAYRIQDAAWVESIRAGTVVGPTVWDGLIARAVVDAILRSLAHHGARVDVEAPERPAFYY